MITVNLDYTNMGHTVKSFQEILENLRELDNHDAIQCHEYDETSKNQLIEDCKEFLEYFDNQNSEQPQATEITEEQPEITEETSEDVEAQEQSEIDEEPSKEVILFREQQVIRTKILLTLDFRNVKGIGEKLNASIQTAILDGTVKKFDQLVCVKGISIKKYESETMQKLRNKYEYKCITSSIYC